MNVSALPLPAQEGINFCEIDGTPFFRVIDLADKFFPQKYPGRDNLEARQAARMLEDKKRVIVANVTKGADRRGHYLPVSDLEDATDLFQDPAVRREITNRSGAIIGSIMKEKRIKAAMTEAETTTRKLRVTIIDHVIFNPKNGAPSFEVPAIFVDSETINGVTLALKGGAVFVEALTIANIINPRLSDTRYYEAIKSAVDAGGTIIHLREPGIHRAQRFISANHLDQIAENLFRSKSGGFSVYEAEHIANIKSLIAEAVEGWPAAHSKSADEDGLKPLSFVGVNPARPAPSVNETETTGVSSKIVSADNSSEPAVETLSTGQKLLAAIEDLQKNSLIQSAAINAQREIIDGQIIAINRLMAVINDVRAAQNFALKVGVERARSAAVDRSDHYEKLSDRINSVFVAVKDGTPKAARPLLGRLFGNA